MMIASNWVTVFLSSEAGPDGHLLDDRALRGKSAHPAGADEISQSLAPLYRMIGHKDLLESVFAGEQAPKLVKS
jgi:hypothetical protein